MSNVLWQQSVVFSIIKKKKKKLVMQQPLSENWRTQTQREIYKRQGVVRDSTICFLDSHLCRKDKELINLSRTRLKSCEKKENRCIHNAQGGGDEMVVKAREKGDAGF